MNQKKPILYKILSLLTIPILLASFPSSPAKAADCSDVLSTLSSYVVDGVNSNKSFYVQVMNETGVPWEMLAAIHYRETSFSHTNPSNGQGIFQFVNGDGGPYPAGLVSDGEFVRQLKFMAEKIQNDYVWRGSVARERRQLQANEQNVAIVKDTLFSYNGRSSQYIDQASLYGYNSSLQPYEGSPYVMNRFDCPRARMGIITKDYGSIDSVDTRYGAFTVFARLRGDGYWQGLWSAPYGGMGDGFILAKSDNSEDLRQWIIYGNMKQHVPSPEVLAAWGLQDQPLSTLNWETMSAFVEGPPLDTLMRVNNGTAVYLVDSGKKYHIQTPHMMSSWNLNHKVISNVTNGLFNHLTNGGRLTYSVNKHGDPSIYMVDGVSNGNVVLRQYQGIDVYDAWEGENKKSISVSAALFDQMDNAIGSPITHTKVAYENNEYQVISGQKLYLGTGAAPLYPEVAQSISSYTFFRLITNRSEVSRYVRATNSQTIYLMDNGQKHAIANPNMVRAWATGVSPKITLVAPGFVNLIPTGTPLTTYFGQSNSGQLYLMDGRKITIPSSIDQSWRTGNTIFTASDSLLALMPSSSTNASLFIKSFERPHVYIMENGKRRHITNPVDLGLWTNGNNNLITQISSYITEYISGNGTISSYITDGSGNNYIANGSNKLPVNGAAASDWGLSSPSVVSSNILSQLSTGSSIPSDKAKVGSTYYRVENGRSMGSSDSNLINIWQVSGATEVPSWLVKKTQNSSLYRFVRSTNTSDSRVFILDNGNLYHITSPLMLQALGHVFYPGITSISPDSISSMLSDQKFSSPIIKSNGNDFYVIDNGTKRGFIDDSSKNQWTNNGNFSALTMSDSWLNMFRNSESLAKTIKGGGPAIYAISNGAKQWIMSSATYNSGYAPYTQTTDLLIDTLPSGVNIP